MKLPLQETARLKKELLDALIRLRNHAAFVTRATPNCKRAVKDVERAEKRIKGAKAH